MNLLKDNYLKLLTAPFSLTFDPLPKFTKNFYAESITAAEIIYAQKQGQLYLMYSGGLDSEYTLSLFLSLGMNITPVIIRLCPDYNIHETQYAFDYCASKNITPIIIDIDFDHFVKSGKMLELATQMKIGIYHYSAIAHSILNLDGTIIMGDGEPYIKNRNNSWFVEIYNYEFGIGNFFKQNNILGTPYFLRYTKEMMISFLKHDIIKDLASNKIVGKLGSNSSKIYVYNDSGFNLKPRQKLHGYEVIETSEIFKHEDFSYFHHHSHDEKFSQLYFDFIWKR